MNKKVRPRGELLSMIIGMLMIIGGVFYFMTKVRVTSVFFYGDENWPLWASFACLIPLVVGIVLMIVMPKRWAPRVVSLVSVIFLMIMIAYQTTLHLQTRLQPHQWLIIGVTVIGGLAIILITLFAKKKDKNEKR